MKTSSTAPAIQLASSARRRASSSISRPRAMLISQALSRIDRKGFPLHPHSGKPIDNLGRVVDSSGYALDGNGNRLRGPDGAVLQPAPRTRVCEDWTAEAEGLKDLRIQGSWFRCCGGQIRKLVDCCSFSRRRINGDASLTGYCWGGRRVYCVMYYDTGLPC